MSRQKSNHERTTFTTTIDKKILLDVKMLAIQQGKRVNDLIEEALKNYYKL